MVRTDDRRSGPAAGGRLRIRPGLCVVPTGGGILVEGGLTRRRLSLPGGPQVLSTLAQLLRGPCGVAEIVDATGLPETTVERLVRVLEGESLLAAELPGEHLIPVDVAVYLDRRLDEIAAHATVAQAAAKLRQCVVVHAGDSPIAAEICADLRASGIGQVLLVPSGAPADVGLDLSAVPDVLVVSPDPESSFDAGQQVLRYRATAGAAEVGPVFGAPATPCRSCFQLSHEKEFPASAPPDAATESDTLIAHIVATVLAVAAGIGDPVPANRLSVIRGAEQVEHYVAAAEPGCEWCRAAGLPTQAGNGAEVYETQTAQFLAYRDIRQNPAPASVRAIEAASRHRIEYPTAPRIPLPERDLSPVPQGRMTAQWVASDRVPAVPAVQAVPVEESVAGLLTRVAGFRQAGAARRWTASGGNMASTEAYLIPARPMFGVAAGSVLKYDDLEHQLIRVRRTEIDVAAATARLGLPAEPLTALVYLVGNIRRPAVKYGRFAFRLAHLDAGCAAAQLHAVAAGFGFGTRFAHDLDEDGAAALELAAGSELVMGVAGLYEEEQSCR